MATAKFITITYELDIIKSEDRRGDEPQLQVAFVSTVDRALNVQMFSSSALDCDLKQGTLRGIIFSDKIPNTEEPFLGIAIRAMDQDKSSKSDRKNDFEALEDSIRNTMFPIFRDELIPTPEQLWEAANAAKIKEVSGIRRDKDDRIGVSARTFPELGLLLDDLPCAEDLNESFTLRFMDNGCHYLMQCKLSARSE